MKKIKILLTTAAILIGSLCFAQKNKLALKYAKTITQKALKDKLSVIASDSLEGRATGSTGMFKAAHYIAEHFKNIGLQTGNKNEYQQPYKLYQKKLIEQHLNINGVELTPNKDFTTNVLNINETITNASLHFEDETTSMADKVVLILDSSTALPNQNLLDKKIETIKANKAKGVIIVQFGKKLKASRNTSSSLQPFDDNNNFFIIHLSETIFKQFEKETEITANVNVKTQQTILEGLNVLGSITGSEKPNEYVFITAHFDHLGIHDGIIHYGADDDGTGTTAVMQLAEAFSYAYKKGIKPKRSIMFMTVSGEELGLWGSRYFSEYPTVDLKNISADLNIDMIGRKDPSFLGDTNNYIYVIGDDKLSSLLTPITDSVNKTYSHLTLDRKFNDPNDVNRFYYRSDHFNFAKNGVPAIFYFNGVHADYHKPTDTVDKINFDLMQKRCQLIFYTAWDIANRNELLPRDKGM